MITKKDTTINLICAIKLLLRFKGYVGIENEDFDHAEEMIIDAALFQFGVEEEEIDFADDLFDILFDQELSSEETC